MRPRSPLKFPALSPRGTTSAGKSRDLPTNRELPRRHHQPARAVQGGCSTETSGHPGVRTLGLARSPVKRPAPADLRPGDSWGGEQGGHPLATAIAVESLIGARAMLTGHEPVPPAFLPAGCRLESRRYFGFTGRFMRRRPGSVLEGAGRSALRKEATAARRPPPYDRPTPVTQSRRKRRTRRGTPTGCSSG